MNLPDRYDTLSIEVDHHLSAWLTIGTFSGNIFHGLQSVTSTNFTWLHASELIRRHKLSDIGIRPDLFQRLACTLAVLQKFIQCFYKQPWANKLSYSISYGIYHRTWIGAWPSGKKNKHTLPMKGHSHASGDKNKHTSSLIGHGNQETKTNMPHQWQGMATRRQKQTYLINDRAWQPGDKNKHTSSMTGHGNQETKTNIPHQWQGMATRRQKQRYLINDRAWQPGDKNKRTSSTETHDRETMLLWAHISFNNVEIRSFCSSQNWNILKLINILSNNFECL